MMAIMCNRGLLYYKLSNKTNRMMGKKIKIKSRKFKSPPPPDRLNLPSVLVLSGCGITKAGDEAEVAAFCAHVVELDLSHNQLQDWAEVSSTRPQGSRAGFSLGSRAPGVCSYCLFTQIRCI